MTPSDPSIDDRLPRALRGSVIALLLGIVACNAHADILEFTFEGSLTQDPFGVSHIGAPVSGSYRFDSLAVDDIAAPGQGSYTSTGPAFGFNGVVDGTSYVTMGALNIGTQAGRPGLYLVTGIAGELTLELVLGDDSGLAVANDALPLAAPDLARFGVREFRLFAPEVEFTATLGHLEGGVPSVPEPFSAALLLAGVSLISAWRVRRHAVGRSPSLLRISRTPIHS